jgi:hypothetical protein
VKNWRKACFKINNSIPTQIFGLFIRDALQRLLGLHKCNRVREALQIFCETPLIRAAEEPPGKLIRISGWKAGVLGIYRQLNHRLGP